MQQLDSDLWVSDSQLRFLGVELGARMTVIRLEGGRLLLHSPIPATAELMSEVEGLGTVSYLVAPNRFHHLYVGDWLRAYPDAALFVAPGLEKKRPDLTKAVVLTDSPESAWADEVDQAFVGGFPLVNEVVMFHRPSKTLVATDLAFNIHSSSPLLTRLFIRLSGTYGRLAPTLLERVGIRDRSAFRRSLERMFDWPFERVIVAHGEIAETGGREELQRGYAWLLGEPR